MLILTTPASVEFRGHHTRVDDAIHRTKGDVVTKSPCYLKKEDRKINKKMINSIKAGKSRVVQPKMIVRDDVPTLNLAGLGRLSFFVFFFPLSRWAAHLDDGIRPRCHRVNDTGDHCQKTEL